ncbi:metalloregulator ArsR/SmtB family transcription factor [bacterium]|nr:metalloregulator ArsR/SmtB family transcription factor [candidate division CSSED10-310 bacterium]
MITFLKSIANDSRLDIIAALMYGEFSVMEIVRILSMGQSRISRHLRILQDSGILKQRREGSRVFYSLDKAGNREMMDVLIRWIKGEKRFEGIQNSVGLVLEQRRLRSQVFFSKMADQWSFLKNRYLDEESLRKVMQEAISKVGVLADLGCGTGETLKVLMGRAEQLIGVDNSPEMLQAAARNLQLVSTRSVDLRLGDLEHLPMRDCEADVLVASLVLHHLARPESVFAEFFRVLRPRGRVVLIEFEEHDDAAACESMGDLWFGFSRRNLKDWMISAGMKSVRAVSVPGGRNRMKLLKVTGIKPFES